MAHRETKEMPPIYLYLTCVGFWLGLFFRIMIDIVGKGKEGISFQHPNAFPWGFRRSYWGSKQHMGWLGPGWTTS
jgi:hypothetical protein